MDTSYKQENKPAPGRQFRARLEIGFGIAVVGLLVLCNIIRWFEPAFLTRIDAPLQPPQNVLLQRLTYHPPVATQSGQVTEFFGFTPLDSTGSRLELISRPGFTAVIGRPYMYELEAEPESVQYRLDQAPSGMVIDPERGVIEWIPDDTMFPGVEIPVRVSAYREDGTAVQQAFVVKLSRYPHAFGTDGRGRDVIAGLILGAQWTIVPGLIVAGLALLLGVGMGGLAGYYEGCIDGVLSYMVHVVESFPALILIFLVGAISSFQFLPIFVVVGIVWFPRMARVIREKVLQLKARQFVEASRELGLSDTRILRHEIIWYNARYIMLSQTFYAFAFAILVEVTLVYLNLIYPQPNQGSWGEMLVAGKKALANYEYWLILFPSAAILLTLSAYYLLGAGLQKQIEHHGAT